DLFNNGGELAAQLPGEPYAENLADAVGWQPPQTDFAAALEDFVHRKETFEDKVPAVLDLRDGVKARESHLAAFLLCILCSHDAGPVIELYANDLRTKPDDARL